MNDKALQDTLEAIISCNISSFIRFDSPKITREFKGKNKIELPEEYIILDLETTGFDTSFDEIIEIGCLKIKNNEIVSSFSTLVKPQDTVDEFITELTGITNKMLENAPKIETILPKLLDFINDSYVIGYNVNFDINFLYDNSIRILNKPFKNDFIDIMRFTRKLYPNLKNHKLKTVCEYLNISTENNHRAEIDCNILFQVIKNIKEHIILNAIDYKSLFLSYKAENKIDTLSTTVTEFDESHILYGSHCVFTGKLQKMTRIQALQKVLDFGGICDKSVNKFTNFLIVGNFDYASNVKNNKSTKILKAEKLISSGQDLTIISENAFYDMIE